MCLGCSELCWFSLCCRFVIGKNQRSWLSCWTWSWEQRASHITGCWRGSGTWPSTASKQVQLLAHANIRPYYLGHFISVLHFLILGWRKYCLYFSFSKIYILRFYFILDCRSSAVFQSAVCWGGLLFPGWEIPLWGSQHEPVSMKNPSSQLEYCGFQKKSHIQLRFLINRRSHLLWLVFESREHFAPITSEATPMRRLRCLCWWKTRCWEVCVSWLVGRRAMAFSARGGPPLTCTPWISHASSSSPRSKVRGCAGFLDLPSLHLHRWDTSLKRCSYEDVKIKELLLSSFSLSEDSCLFFIYLFVF